MLADDKSCANCSDIHTNQVDQEIPLETSILFDCERSEEKLVDYIIVVAVGFADKNVGARVLMKSTSTCIGEQEIIEIVTLAVQLTTCEEC